MNAESDSLEPGLYLVSAPIGAARDITLRALDILAAADVICAEDTRTVRRLLNIHGIPLNRRRVIAYNDANGARRRPAILERLRLGASVCYIPDAGTPLIADPGYRLVEEALSEGIRVVSAPGASSVIAALTVSGLPTDRFLFAGFLPPTRARRRRELAGLGEIGATLVILETARRLSDALSDMADILGGERRIAVCRELTKRFEQVERGRLGEMNDLWSDGHARGEIVLVVEGQGRGVAADPAELEGAARRLLETMTVRDAAGRMAAEHGLSRSRAYRMMLSLSADGRGTGDAGKG